MSSPKDGIIDHDAIDPKESVVCTLILREKRTNPMYQAHDVSLNSPAYLSSAFASSNLSSSSVREHSLNSNLMPVSAQVFAVHSAYFLAAGSSFASKPTRRGGTGRFDSSVFISVLWFGEKVVPH